MEESILLPDHVIEEILLRLPVKDLLRWKCVSKYWYALIWDDEFVKRHYHFQYAMHLAQGDVPHLLRNFDEVEPITAFHLLTKQGARDVVVNFTPEFERDVVPPTFSSDSRICDRRMGCIGVVNGIVGLKWGRATLALWNPATREFKDVPRWPIMMADKNDDKVIGSSIKGLGFDLRSNDFKILGLTNTSWGSPTRTDYIYEFHLYSLKADSWKRIKDTLRTRPLLDSPFTDAYFNNGVHYWISDEEDSSRSGIVAFNFSSETFKEFELPWDQESWYSSDLVIGKYKEELALLVNHPLESNETCIEIWVAIRLQDDDYEVYSSWELVVKTSPIFVAQACDLCMGTILDSGDILFSIYHDDKVYDACDGRFAESGAYVYQPSTCTFNYLGISFSSSYRYVESLFPLSTIKEA